MNDLADSYIYVLVALLPLAASMVVFQANPYHALVIRGMLGAVAALVYAVLGAVDVALTEALMGTMLAITLYAIAVRSSLVMRLGIVEGKDDFGQLFDELRTIVGKHYMRVELIPYADRQSLQQALTEREIHATCVRLEDERQPYCIEIAPKRLYEIMQTELSSPDAIVRATTSGEKS